MFDNGILKYYIDNPHKDGYLDSKVLGISHNVTGTKRKVEKVIIGGENFYLKSATPFEDVSKRNMDAEILLSQLYCKAGIESAIYLPAENEYGKFLVCDDVTQPNIISAGSHLFPYLSGTENHTLPFLCKANLGVNLPSILTQNAMMEQTKMRILDTASFNTDRHYFNFFYKLKRPSQQNGQQESSMSGNIMQYFRNLISNPANEVVSIDYEISGEIIDRLARGYEDAGKESGYDNDFSYSPLIRTEMMEEIKSNEELANLIDKKEFAEEIGSLNPSAVAEDIKQTIGYEVNPKAVDVLSKSYDEMAETLLL